MSSGGSCRKGKKLRGSLREWPTDSRDLREGWGGLALWAGKGWKCVRSNICASSDSVIPSAFFYLWLHLCCYYSEFSDQSTNTEQGKHKNMSFSKMKEHKAGKEKGCGISVPRMVLILQIDCVIPSCNNFTSTTLMQSLFPCCLGYISVQTWNPQCFPQPTTVYAESGPPSGKKFPVSPVLLPTRITWDI